MKFPRSDHKISCGTPPVQRRIVAFHPEYLKYGFSVAAGDRIAVANFDGTSSSATVLDEEGGLHPDGEELLDVRFDNGEEFLIRYSSCQLCSISFEFNLCFNFGC